MKQTMILNKIIQGDCIKVMKEIPENSIDTIITDPPYGLEFMGKNWDKGVPGIPFWKEMLRVVKPGATLLCFGGTRTFHRLACAIEDAGWVIKDTLMWLYSTGFPKATDIKKSGEKSGKDMRGWNGWKSHGLKPAYEPIIMAMKPNEKTYANNALKWGVSGLNIDGGRIGTNDKLGRKNNVPPYGSERTWSVSKTPPQDNTKNPPQGRFPANLLLNEEAAKMLDKQSGDRKSPKKRQTNSWFPTGKNNSVNGEAEGYGDTGGASRFFYVAKASKTERNMGLEGLEEKDTKRYGDFEGTPDHAPKKDVKNTNHHPTVKPLKLMEYLCLLTKTPTGGVVLDPFAGSGTTLMACKLTGRDFIGIEKEPEYCKIAEARIKATPKPLL